MALVAVSKSVDPSRIEEAWALGQRDFGENRVEALEEKAQYFASRGTEGLRWHFLGRLSTKKMARLLGVAHLAAIHSVDSLAHLKGLWSRGDRAQGPVELFLQVNTSGEAQKAGFEGPGGLEEALVWAKAQGSSPLKVVGLMAMGARGEREGESFRALKELRDALDPSLKLSMGMSEDYGQALRFGASVVRIGTLLWR